MDSLGSCDPSRQVLRAWVEGFIDSGIQAVDDLPLAVAFMQDPDMEVWMFDPPDAFQVETVPFQAVEIALRIIRPDQADQANRISPNSGADRGVQDIAARRSPFDLSLRKYGIVECETSYGEIHGALMGSPAG